MGQLAQRASDHANSRDNFTSAGITSSLAPARAVVSPLGADTLQSTFAAETSIKIPGQHYSKCASTISNGFRVDGVRR